jgi:hypothetical protein
MKGEILFAMERSATALFGVVTYGVHMTAYVPPTQFRPMRIWTPTRSLNKPSFPGMLDNTVLTPVGVTNIYRLVEGSRMEWESWIQL